MRDRIETLAEQMLDRIADKMEHDQLDAEELNDLSASLRNVAEAVQSGEYLEDEGHGPDGSIDDAIAAQRRLNSSLADQAYALRFLPTPEQSAFMENGLAGFALTNGTTDTPARPPVLEGIDEGPVEWVSPDAHAAALAATPPPVDDDPDGMRALEAEHAGNLLTAAGQRWALVIFDDQQQLSQVAGPYAGLIHGIFREAHEANVWLAQPDQMWKDALRGTVNKLTTALRQYAADPEFGELAREALAAHEAWIAQTTNG